MENTIATRLSFSDYLFKTRQNRTILCIAAVAIIAQFSIFKYLYPYASYIHGDSFSYLTAAEKNLNIDTYMIGYSKFLRLISVFTSSDMVLVIFQFLFLQVSAFFFLVTLFYFYQPSKTVQIILLCFTTFNPLFYHMANLISSDCLFLALSLIWFSLLIWIIHKPTTQLIIWHGVILFIVFTIRYNALIYPFISAAAFALSRLPFRKKMAGIAIGVILCGTFISYTTYKYKELTGYWQYSPFSGWQFANNAMYAYRYVNTIDRKPVPKKFEALDNMIRAYFDSTHDLNKYPLEKVQASTFYMWSKGMPLTKYRDSLFKKDTSISEFKKWACMGPLYKAYGLYIIRQYPSQFIHYFIWPNANKYYAPPIEFLEKYNSGKKDVTDQAKNWFGYKSRTTNTRMKNNKVLVLDFYPILSGIVNVVMLFALIFHIVLKGWRHNIVFSKGILLGGTVWMLNAGFTIFASSAALRFQSFPILLTTIFVMLLIDWLLIMSKSKPNTVSIVGIQQSTTNTLPNEVLA